MSDQMPTSRFTFFFLLLLLHAGCSSVPMLPTTPELPVPAAPDYARTENWAALPTTDDHADRTPGDSLRDGQLTASVDVFYVHPTIYWDTRKGNNLWNADLADKKLNDEVDESAILNHASIFNAAGRVYAPRYRQAHLSVFREAGRKVKKAALDTAYDDVLAAFDHFVSNFNRGRPIIIAAHSQGTLHAQRLLHDRFEKAALGERLVAAYLVGMPVPVDEYRDIPVCTSAAQTGCFVSWRTFREDFVPEAKDTLGELAVVNPLSWDTTSVRVPREMNRGGVLYDYDSGPRPGLVFAEIRGNGLYTNKPKFFGDIFFNTKNYHIGDYNLFWLNVRENAVTRAAAFGRKL